MDGQGTKRHRNIANDFNRLSKAQERYRRQTDSRQTDDRRQTDGRRHYSESLKNGILHLYILIAHKRQIACTVGKKWCTLNTRQPQTINRN